MEDLHHIYSCYQQAMLSVLQLPTKFVVSVFFFTKATLNLTVFICKYMFLTVV